MATVTNDPDVPGAEAMVGIEQATVSSSTEIAKPNYEEDLCTTDEPLIFRYGGKLIRDYINDADFGSSDRDYEMRALCKTVVTNGSFLRVFKDARLRKYGQRPIGFNAFLKGELSRSSKTMEQIQLLAEVGKGFLTLFAMEAKPSEIGNYGANRVKKAVATLQKHPATKYISRALLELANISSRGSKSNYIMRFLYQRDGYPESVPRDADEVIEADKRDDELMDRMERAVFEGDMAWFQSRYDSVLESEEQLPSEIAEIEAARAWEELVECSRGVVFDFSSGYYYYDDIDDDDDDD